MFDCDNTLVLSEELAFEACADLANEILKKYGKEHRYTGPELLVDFVGQNFRGMLKSLCTKFGITMTSDEEDSYVSREEVEVIKKLEAKAQPCHGVMPVLEKLFKEKKYGMSVVSSSALRRVRASIKKVGQEHFFPYEHVYSAATSLPKPTTKPDPAVYLYAMEQVGKKPEECVAVEDSKSGATAAVRAKIATIGYTGSYEGEQMRAQMAETLATAGCKVIMHNWSEFEKCLAEIEKA